MKTVLKIGILCLALAGLTSCEDFLPIINMENLPATVSG